MSGSRRVQRSTRIALACGLLALSAILVIAAVATTVAVAVAALGALVAGAAASRIMYAEVVQTRGEAAREHAEQARSFGTTMSRVHHEHRRFTASMGARLADRDRTITQLNGTLRLAEIRIGEAETRATREGTRADETQERLTALLDEVLAQPHLTLVEADEQEAPTIVDLLAWEERVTQAAEASQASLTDSRSHA